MFNNNEITVYFNEFTYGKEFKRICDVYPIVPAKKTEKSWWKIMKTHYEFFLDRRGKFKNLSPTIKYCPGIVDFTNCGYIIPAWQDFQFFIDDKGQIEHKVPLQMQHIKNVAAHPAEQIDTCPVLGKTAADMIKLVSPWLISTPKGTSLMMCKPFYHYSNDFDVCPGIMDSDIDRESNKLVPVFIRFNVRNKVIHIKAGQPLMQLIPFKRTNWKLKHSELDGNFKDMMMESTILKETKFPFKPVDDKDSMDKDSMTKFRHDDSNKKFEIG